MAGGYDLERFIHPVEQDFCCSICRFVLRDVRLCESGEHHFCFNCISRYLNDSRTCPVCRQPLTPETLKRPQRFLRNRLSELMITCDYSNRGCPERIELGNLQNHVNGCEFRPITCQSCGLGVSAREKDIHQNFCDANLRHIQMLRWNEIMNSYEEFRVSTNTFEENIKNNITEICQGCNDIGSRVNRIEGYLSDRFGFPSA